MRIPQIRNRLRVLPGPPGSGGMVVVPGCEPSSSLTSPTLFREIKEADVCKSSLVTVADALEAIPGSEVVTMLNYEVQSGKTWLVLPPLSTQCPQEVDPDWYKILRGLGNEFTEEEIEEITGIECQSFSLSPHEDGGMLGT